jgi:hypothetical protein
MSVMTFTVLLLSLIFADVLFDVDGSLETDFRLRTVLPGVYDQVAAGGITEYATRSR